MAAGRILYGKRYGDRISAESRAMIESLRNASYAKARRIYAHLLREPQWPAEIAYACCNDRYFLLTCVLRRPDAFHPWVYARCREVETNTDGYLDLWARGHFKSSLITFAGSIQEIIKDPDVTIAIFSITKDIAAKFLSQIKEEIEQNPSLRATFPDVFWDDPAVESPLWSARAGLVVRRLGNPKEATVEAYGLLNGIPTGSHYRLRIYDDVITERVVTQTDTEQVKKITTQWELSQNLGTIGSSRMWHAGTRYHYGDTYGELIQNDILNVRLYPATHNGKLDGRPVLLTQEKWDEQKLRQRSTVAAQMLQNPLAGSESTFSVLSLRPYQVRPRVMNVYILCDPSMGRTRQSDRTAMIVIGIDGARNGYLLDGYCHRMRLTERWEHLRALHEKWKAAPGVLHVRVGYERYGLQTDQEHFEEKMILEKLPMDIMEVHWTSEGNQSKNQRIARLEPWFTNSRMWMPPKVWMPTVGTCLWYIDKETLLPQWVPLLTPERRDQIAAVMENPDIDPDAKDRIVASMTMTKEDRAAIAAGEPWRVMDPIKRLDEDRKPYDLTRLIFSEYSMHPRSPHDDALDAMSRIEDVQLSPPIAPEVMRDLEPPAYGD